MNFVIRSLHRDDMLRIQLVEQACFAHDVQEDPSVYLQRIKTFPAGNLGFFIDDLLVGFFCSELWEETKELDVQRFELAHDIRTYHRENGTLLYISSFAIDPLYRHLLRGKTAFTYAMDQLIRTIDFSSVILLVAAAWHPARAIYRNWGFVEKQHLTACFASGDGIIMRAKGKTQQPT